MAARLAILGLIFFLAACRAIAPPENRSVALGMPKRDVLLFMGTPVAVESAEGVEILEYHLQKDIREPYAAPQPYWVVIRDGTVAAFGKPEEIKKQNLPLVPPAIQVPDKN